MDTKVVYQTDHLGIYTGKTVADRSPLEPNVWLIPGGCVEVAPPAVPERKAAFWDGRKWQLVDSYQGLTVYNTATRAPMVIERAGALPAGYTLEVPGPGQIWGNGHWVDDIPTVLELRYTVQLAAVNKACLQELHEASDRGIVVVNLTQCMSGKVNMGGYATGNALAHAGVIGGADMTVEATLTKLHYLLSQELDTETIRKAMSQNLRGELTPDD